MRIDGAINKSTDKAIEIATMEHETFFEELECLFVSSC